MTKKELWKKYNIDKSHDIWDNQIDNWYSIEIYRLMHDGNLPPEGDKSILWVCDFLDKSDDMAWWSKNVMSKPNWGSYYMTAKRMVATMSEVILEAYDSQKSN